MYVKLFNRILDSSLADNRKLRHFFIDLLLCSDPDGNVLMTKTAIANRIRADLVEVEWGLTELQKPDPLSLCSEHEGRRVAPLENHGYGWKILNYEFYRDLKSAQQMREATADRVRSYRERKTAGISVTVEKSKKPSALYLSRERRGARAYVDGDDALGDEIAAEGLPAPQEGPENEQ